MHSPFRSRGVILAGLLALALAAVTPTVATAKPQPGAKQSRGFRLFARPLGAMSINRVLCGLSADGKVCPDSLGSSTIGGGFWPKGTVDQYIFNSGLQLAGIIGSDGGPWAGDTTGAFFFDPKGLTEHGEQVRGIFNSSSPDDIAAWDPAARVPKGDVSADLFFPLLQVDSTETDLRRRKVSQGDTWWMSWDGNPALASGRPHPLGVAVETRGMGWNFPTGNEDIIYFIYTFYNVTTTNRADYVGIRPEMVDILVGKAQEFQAKNNAAFGVTLPAGGYTLNQMYAAFGTDMDVAAAITNFSSVNLPFALGYTYEDVFKGEAAWTFDPTIFAPPFMPGAGFAGIKYLKSPSGPGEIQLFSNTVNTSASFRPIFVDAANTTQLWRYLSGNISVAAGDLACNSGNQILTKVCWLNNTGPADMRFFQSSTELTLPPGGQGSIVVAYIFAAPVPTGSCPSPGCASRKPGDPTRLGNPALMALGVNAVDTMTGYLSASDLDGNGKVEQSGALGPEWKVVTGSLLGKSYVAQAVFDAKFLLPFAPDPPDFFLIPGDNQVTVLWQPSKSEANGDPFFSLAQDVTNALYDPNYRHFDVEGYRVYRGRVNNAASLTLIAQFDFAGTVFEDFDGVVNPVETCAPELNITTDCPAAFDSVAPGLPRTVSNAVNIVSPFLQTKFGDRLKLAVGTALVTKMDTAVTGENSKLLPLTNSGVPFVFVDKGARNNFRYFYVVTAFDVNSLASGPSSLESPKALTKSITPEVLASNYANSSQFSDGIFGRNTQLDHTSPVVLDAATGRFAGIMPASNAWTIGFQDFVQQVISAPGNFAVRLDSMDLGSAYSGVPGTYYYSAINGPDTTALEIEILQDVFNSSVTANATFNAVAINNSLASLYGGSDAYSLKGQVGIELEGNYYTNAYGRGCVNGAPGFDVGGGCNYNGPRWFAGPSPANNETKVDPIFGNQANFTTGTVDIAAPNNTGWNNAGELPGVSVIHQPYSYQTMGNQWRDVEGVGGLAKRQADYNVYWGAAGRVDSVIDATHNVPVPFDTTGRYRGGWGILNQSAAQPSGPNVSFDQRTELTVTDVGCVEPYRSFPNPQNRITCGTAAPLDGPIYRLANTAIPGPIAHFTINPADSRTRAAAAENGFVMLLGGNMFMFQLAGGVLPAAGTVWSMRDYVGAITGGNGFGGNNGPYAYFQLPRPFSAVGAELRVVYDVVNQVNATSNNDLSRIHTVPDPYYVTNGYEVDFNDKIIKFVNLPQEAIIRIYSVSGVLVRVLKHSSPQLGGAETWDVRNRNNQFVASGVYFYHVESGDARHIGRMTIVNFAK